MDVRPFSRSDRDGLTSLVNRHVAACLPGGSIPTATLLSQMERDAGEYIIDPWVIDRHTLVGIERDRVVAAAHLKRYRTDGAVSDSYRNLGVVDWLVCDPAAIAVGTSVLKAAGDVLRGWRVGRLAFDGSLPALGVYGVPDSWPHIEHLLVEAGYDDAGGQIEWVLAGDLNGIGRPGAPPVEDIQLRRVVGGIGVVFEAHLDGELVGVFEVEDTYGTANAQLARWADEGSHWVHPDHRGRGIGSWLVRNGAEWLRLGGKDRFLTYAVERRAAGMDPMDNMIATYAAYWARFGVFPITRTRRGWQRPPG